MWTVRSTPKRGRKGEFWLLVQTLTERGCCACSADPSEDDSFHHERAKQACLQLHEITPGIEVLESCGIRMSCDTTTTQTPSLLHIALLYNMGNRPNSGSAIGVIVMFILCPAVILRRHHCNMSTIYVQSLHLVKTPLPRYVSTRLV